MQHWYPRDPDTMDRAVTAASPGILRFIHHHSASEGSRLQSKIMSLPRADYDPRRVCVNPCPNFTLGLGKHKRTVGVYLAGALVRPHPFRSTDGFRTRT